MKVYKIIIMVITIIMIIGIRPTKAFASEQAGSGSTTVKSFDQMKDDINNFIQKGKDGNTGMSSEDMGQVIVPIANILTAIGVLVLVGATIIMGIKYMFASPEEAAKLKQQLIGLVVAGVVILGATAIWKLVYNLLNNSGI